MEVETRRDIRGWGLRLSHHGVYGVKNDRDALRLYARLKYVTPTCEQRLVVVNLTSASG